MFFFFAIFKCLNYFEFDRGDSGSALVVRGYLQIGIVSHKISDVSASLIVYTDVPYYYNWISAASRALFCRYTKQ